MYDEILVPTEGSAAAENALDHAVGIAERFGARIHLLYVVDTGAYAALGTGTEMVVDALSEEGEEVVADAAATVEDAGVEATTGVATGSVHRRILEYAEENDVSLIVMGTHGRQGLDRYLLGSVTERVVRSADPPVLTVRQHEGESG